GEGHDGGSGEGARRLREVAQEVGRPGDPARRASASQTSGDLPRRGSPSASGARGRFLPFIQRQSGGPLRSHASRLKLFASHFQRVGKAGKFMSEETSHTPTGATPERKTPSLFRNYLSLFGAAIVAASLASIVLLFLIELSVGTENPYLGIFTYVILPGFLIFGIVTILAGMYFVRRSRRSIAY